MASRTAARSCSKASRRRVVLRLVDLAGVMRSDEVRALVDPMLYSAAATLRQASARLRSNIGFTARADKATKTALPPASTTSPMRGRSSPLVCVLVLGLPAAAGLSVASPDAARTVRAWLKDRADVTMLPLEALSPEELARGRAAELKNGRLAMIGIIQG